MLITSTVEICIQHLCRVEEMVFAARRSYASAVLGVVILSVCPSVRLSVCHTRALSLIQRTYWRHFSTTWKGNPPSQMWFSYCCAAADKISTDLRARAVSLLQLSYLFYVCFVLTSISIPIVCIMFICVWQFVLTNFMTTTMIMVN